MGYQNVMWWLFLLHIQDAWLETVADSFFFVILHNLSNTHLLLVNVCSRGVPKQTLLRKTSSFINHM